MVTVIDNQRICHDFGPWFKVEEARGLWKKSFPRLEGYVELAAIEFLRRDVFRLFTEAWEWEIPIHIERLTFL